VGALVSVTTQRCAELEWPQEVVGLFEAGSDSDNLVDKILNADDVLFAERLLDDGVLSQRNALFVDFTVTTFVDHVRHGLQVGLAVSDVRLDVTEHGHGGVVDLQEDGVVDLAQTEELQDLLSLGGSSVDTTNADNEENLRLRLNEKTALVLSLPLHADITPLLVSVLFHVLLGPLEDFLAVDLALLLECNILGLAGRFDFLEGFPLLEEGLRNRSGCLFT